MTKKEFSYYKLGRAAERIETMRKTGDYREADYDRTIQSVVCKKPLCINGTSVDKRIAVQLNKKIRISQ